MSWAGRYWLKRSWGSSLRGAERADRRICDLRFLNRPRSSIGPCCPAVKKNIRVTVLNEFIVIDKYSLVTECLRLKGLADPLLLPDIDTDINDPIDSHPIL